MKALIKTLSNGIESVTYVNGHEIQDGGVGDGYCYGHQSFDCVEKLTVEERAAMNIADYEEDF